MYVLIEKNEQVARLINIQYFFNGTDFKNQVANISTSCATAMQASLDCDPYLTYVMTSDYWGSLHDDASQEEFCNVTCSQELRSYISSVTAACANDPQPLPGYPATYWGESALAAWTQMCLKDNSTGQYCSGNPGTTSEQSLKKHC